MWQTDSAHTKVGDLSSRCVNASNEYDQCGHDTRQFHPSYIAYGRTANLKTDVTGGKRMLGNVFPNNVTCILNEFSISNIGNSLLR